MSSKEGGGKDGGNVIPFIRVVREKPGTSPSEPPAASDETGEDAGGATVHDLAEERRKKQRVAPPHRDALSPPPLDTREQEDRLLAKAIHKAAATLKRIYQSQGPKRLADMSGEIEKFVREFDILDNDDILKSIVHLTEHEIRRQPAYCIALCYKLKERFPGIS